MAQICSTLFDYPSIRQCSQLQTFIRKCVNNAWSLLSQVEILTREGHHSTIPVMFQTPAYTIEYEERQFRPEVHVRHHSSHPTSPAVRTYIWPALILGTEVLSKAVVVT